MAGNQRARRLASQLRDMRAVACALPDGLALLDRGNHLRWCNPAAQRLLGIAWPRARGMRVADCLGADGAAVWAQVERGMADDLASPVNGEVRLQLSLTAYGDERRLLVARDISRVRHLEQVRRDFVANVSHELRTPLTVIHGYLELLDPEDVPALAGVLHEMRVQSQRMRQIVEDLLMLSHLEMQQRIDEERVEMTPLLAALRSEAEGLSQGRHRIVVEDTAGFDLQGSPSDLHSAFSNLVSNAVRYTPEGGSIAIGWRRTAHGAEYTVSDTGYGIPAEHLPRLTERFYRVSSSRSRASGGTGLGLSIVKHVLNLHEAQLRVESEPGKGSTFACVFGAGRLLSPSAPDRP
jgi:two-component system phosphate regulon sensor histidine kinase PhoR